MKESNEINERKLIGSWKTTAMLAVIACIFGAPSIAQASPYFNGFEVDASGWQIFGGSYDATRVPSGGGALGVTSASGAWHAESATAAGNWGGYGDNDGCAAAACAAAAFPTYGYNTSVDIYLDVDGGFTNHTRFDFSSAINEAPPSGLHRRDFIFNCGFYNDDTDSGGNGTPSAGANRFICSASNNSQPTSAYPKNPGRMPTVVATATGWYTFLHEFRDDGSGVLTVDLSVLDSGGTVIQTWTLSDPTDVINTTVGGNRYAWFAFNEFGTLALDNSLRTGGPPAYSCVGFEPPMHHAELPPALGGGQIARRVKKNRVFPFKATLLDGDGNVVTDLNSPPVLAVYEDSAPSVSVDITDDSFNNGKRTDGIEFFLAGSKWHHNLASRGFDESDGTYTGVMESGDPSEYVIDPTCEGLFVIEPN